jgi:hypothetical protein
MAESVEGHRIPFAQAVVVRAPSTVKDTKRPFIYLNVD